MRLILPCSASRSARAATKVLLMLPTEKRVLAVTGVLLGRMAEPDWPVHIDPSGKTTAAEMPASLPLARTALSAACRLAAIVESRTAAGAAAGGSGCDVGTG